MSLGSIILFQLQELIKYSFIKRLFLVRHGEKFPHLLFVWESLFLFHFWRTAFLGKVFSFDDSFFFLLLPLSTLNLLHSLMVCKISAEKYADSLIRIYFNVMSLFLLMFLKFYLIFEILIIVYLGADLFG